MKGARPDFLAVGTLTKDLLDSGKTTMGGTVTYASVTAANLGRRTGVVARVDPTFDLSPLEKLGIDICRLPAAETTTFTNLYVDGKRIQYISAVGGVIGCQDIPREWESAPIVHLGPLAQDLPAGISACFPDSLVGVTPQGWMRQWDETGLIRPVLWQNPEETLAHARVLVFSIDDIAGDERLIHRYSNLVEIMVVTQSRRGCTVYCKGLRPRHFPAFVAREVDPTGAGDVFCAAYLIHLAETDDPFASARFANCVASFSVEGLGISAIPTRAQVEKRLREGATVWHESSKSEVQR